MAAGLLLGNAALLFDLNASRPHSHCQEWAPKPRPHDLAPTARARPHHPAPPPLPSVSASRRRRGAGPIAKFAASGGGAAPGGGGDDGDGEEGEWEEELKRRLKELEEMKELERKAEELQGQAATAAAAEDGEKEETEEEKRERVRRELEKVAREQAERRATAKLMFDLGQKAYGKGMYARAIEFLEAALTVIPPPTLLGGEIQIWLAMAYEANKRHRDCIALYKELEKKHPMISIRRQAAELRYILEAPKLKISKEEMVTIPLIGSSYDWYAVSWSDKAKDQENRRKTATTNQVQSSKNYFGDFMFWRPPSGWEKNRNLWAIVTLWICLVGTALYLQR